MREALGPGCPAWLRRHGSPPWQRFLGARGRHRATRAARSLGLDHRQPLAAPQPPPPKHLAASGRTHPLQKTVLALAGHSFGLPSPLGHENFPSIPNGAPDYNCGPHGLSKVTALPGWRAEPLAVAYIMLVAERARLQVHNGHAATAPRNRQH